jgi:hypothetical protein
MWKEIKETRQPSEAPAELHQANAGFLPGGCRSNKLDCDQSDPCAPCIAEYASQLVNVGGLKHDSDKPDLSLVSHELMVSLARVREFGSKKYERDNWRKGFKYNRSIAAALRHIFAFKDGEDYDKESGVTHIAHAIACLEHLLFDFLYHPANDDRYRSPAAESQRDGDANE